MPFAIFCTKSHERSQLPLPGRFLSMHWFTLCITMEAEPGTAKQGKGHHCCICNNYRGKVMENGKKVSFHHFSSDQKFVSAWTKCFIWYTTAQATSYCLLPDTLWQQAFKNAFKADTVNFVNSMSPPSIVKNACAGSKNSQGTSARLGKSQ